MNTYYSLLDLELETVQFLDRSGKHPVPSIRWPQAAQSAFHVWVVKSSWRAEVFNIGFTSFRLVGDVLVNPYGIDLPNLYTIYTIYPINSSIINPALNAIISHQ